MGERIAKLTKRSVDAARPEAERYVVWDVALKGFGLRVEASGTKTFLVRYRIAGRKRFLSIGRFGQLTPEQARGHAQAILADVRHGRDPLEERRSERAAITVAELANRFLAEHRPQAKGRHCGSLQQPDTTVCFTQTWSPEGA